MTYAACVSRAGMPHLQLAWWQPVSPCTLCSCASPTSGTALQAALQAQTGAPIVVAPAHDMWQLGMLVHTLASQPWPYSMPFWGARTAAEHAASALGQPQHERSCMLPDGEILLRLAAYEVAPQPGRQPSGTLNVSGPAHERQPMPHEQRTIGNEALQQIADGLLAPDPAERWTSERLRAELELRTEPLTMRAVRL